MKAILWILILVVTVLLIATLLGYFTSRGAAGAAADAAARRMPDLEPGDLETAAAFVDGGESKLGLLRLTRHTLEFVAGNPDGPDVEIRRQAIATADATRVLPDGRTMSKPFLLVTSRVGRGQEESDAFLIAEPQVWVDRLLG